MVDNTPWKYWRSKSNPIEKDTQIASVVTSSHPHLWGTGGWQGRVALLLTSNVALLPLAKLAELPEVVDQVVLGGSHHRSDYDETANPLCKEDERLAIPCTTKLKYLRYRFYLTSRTGDQISQVSRETMRATSAPPIALQNITKALLRVFNNTAAPGWDHKRINWFLPSVLQHALELLWSYPSHH